MPTSKGISIEIVGELDSRVFPEFPCPQVTQGKIRDAHLLASGKLMSSSPKADRVLGRDPVASAYVPSVKGRFFKFLSPFFTYPSNSYLCPVAQEGKICS